MIFRIKDLGRKNYIETYQLMRDFTFSRNSFTNDEIWLVEHFPVYTLGYSQRKKSITNINNIPLIATDRGGQITYHGPGQLVIYLLIDLKRRPYKVKKLISLIEASVIDYLKMQSINAEKKIGAPGVYIENSKICALGLRVKNCCTYHGLSINVDMNLSPFESINPCGIKGMTTTQIINFKKDITINMVKNELLKYLLSYLDETVAIIQDVA